MRYYNRMQEAPETNPTYVMDTEEAPNTIVNSLILHVIMDHNNNNAKSEETYMPWKNLVAVRREQDR